jgi:cobalt-zinc-cadmium efflux system outer membrane protein
VRSFRILLCIATLITVEALVGPTTARAQESSSAGARPEATVRAEAAALNRGPESPGPALETLDPADRIATALDEPLLRQLVAETLERNPEVAGLAAAASAAEQRAPQVKALPDPVAGITAYLQTPETRVGPQQAMVSLSQRFPWFGKLELREKAALYQAAAARAKVEAARLHLVTEVRRLAYELAFQDVFETVVNEDRTTLTHYEELARTRYASGVGLEQAVIKIQAEITKDDTRLLDIATRRAALRAQLNALRDQPDGTSLPPNLLPRYPELTLTSVALRQSALVSRPEIAGADATIAMTQTQIDLARKEYSPDVTLGLVYALVGTRTDPQGRAMPPPDNGKDVLGLMAGVNLPIHTKKLAAAVAEASDRQLAAEQAKRSVVSGIDRSLDDLVYRIPLTYQRLHLFDDVLSIQAEQSLRSAEAGYAAGTLNALDLLDAERVLLEVRTASARARADYAIGVAQLEGATAGPIVAEAKPEHK